MLDGCLATDPAVVQAKGAFFLTTWQRYFLLLRCRPAAGFCGVFASILKASAFSTRRTVQLCSESAGRPGRTDEYPGDEREQQTGDDAGQPDNQRSFVLYN